MSLSNIHSAVCSLQIVNQTLHKLSLYSYRHQRTGTLSGGNKRKLSTAISIIGNPKLIFMVRAVGMSILPEERKNTVTYI